MSGVILQVNLLVELLLQLLKPILGLFLHVFKLPQSTSIRFGSFLKVFLLPFISSRTFLEHNKRALPILSHLQAFLVFSYCLRRIGSRGQD